jgi:hypothetical protein
VLKPASLLPEPFLSGLKAKLRQKGWSRKIADWYWEEALILRYPRQKRIGIFPFTPKKRRDALSSPKEKAMTMVDFEAMKVLERHAAVNGPLMRLLNERWPTRDEANKQYLEAVERVQKITQEVLDLIAGGLL